MNVVLDTNVLVSALWSSSSKPAAILASVIAGRFTVCYDYRIINEYDSVLHRQKFGFEDWEIRYVLEPILKNGISVVPEPLEDIPFTDESDRKFLEVAKSCKALLITGNVKHYPKDPYVITVSEFCEKFLQPKCPI